ncbi:MAG: FAD-dependent oxidoreductase, partial [Pseudomonadota bacterium]
MAAIKTDLLVIGAGSGGLSVAAGAVQMGADVTLLEKGKMGGDCLNYGCVPSKALLASAKQAHSQTTGEIFGVSAQEPTVDYAAAKAHVADVIAGIAPHDSQERFEGLGVRVIRAHGRFTGPQTVVAEDDEITARRIVIATGSTPFVPPIPGLDQVDYHTNETIFDLLERPEHLLIIGGGPIGLEMAQAHVRLGSRVTVLEGAKALGRDDPELAAVVIDRLRTEGVEIIEAAKVTSVAATPMGVAVETESGRHEGTHILVAVGRKATTSDLDLKKAGVEVTSRGVKVDARLRTTNPKIFAIGDAAGGLQFTHVAGYHAGIVIRQSLFGLPAKAATHHIPWVTFTDPEMAQVGLTEAEARATHGTKLEVLRFPYAENDRARADRATEGLVKVMVVGGRPVGASIVGRQAGELINLWALVLANRLKISAVANMVAPYPTLGELNKRAAGQYYVPRLFQSDTVK